MGASVFLLTHTQNKKKLPWALAAVLPSFIARCKQTLYSSCAEKLLFSVTQ